MQTQSRQFGVGLPTRSRADTAPSHDTFSRVFRLLDPEAFGRAFAAFLGDLGANGRGVLAIDGKALRRSFDRAAGRSPLHVVTAFGAGARVAIGQAAVAETARAAGTRRSPPGRSWRRWRSTGCWSRATRCTPRPRRRR